MPVSNFQSSQESPMRGRVFWVGEDSRREISSYPRREMAKKARWARTNLPIAERIHTALVNKTLGTGLRLQAMTADKEWNKERERLWENKAKSAGVWDVSRRFNFWKMCSLVLGGHHEDGDAFVLKSTTKDKTASRFLFYEGLRVGNGYATAPPENMRDGVLVGKHDDPRKYRFLDGDKHQEIDARKVIAYIDHKRAGHTRGISRFGVALNDLLDRAETKGFLKHGFKVANQFGVYTKGGGTSKKPAFGAASPLPSSGADLRKEELTLERIFGSGKIQDIGKDGEIGTVHDGRPHQNYQMWDEQTIVREISLGLGLPMEVIWNIAKLGGTAGRYVLADAQEFINVEQQRLVDLFASHAYIYDTAVLLEQGALRRPDDPHWWLHGWLTPAKLTVDVGRDGKLQLERHRRALLTMQDLYGCEGKDWERQVDQWFVEREYVLDRALETAKNLEEKHKIEISLDRVLPPEPGAPAAQDADPSEENPPPPPSSDDGEDE